MKLSCSYAAWQDDVLVSTTCVNIKAYKYMLHLHYKHFDTRPHPAEQAVQHGMWVCITDWSSGSIVKLSHTPRLVPGTLRRLPLVPW